MTADAFFGSGAALTGITAAINDYAVTTTKIATSAVTAEKIADGSITNTKLGAGSFSNITGVGTLNSLTVSGTADVTGTLKESGRVLYVPSTSIYSISAGEGITSAMLVNKIIRVLGNGGAVDVSASPPIAAGQDGQVIVLKGTSETNTVKFNSVASLQLSGGYSFILGNNDTLMLCYDSAAALWFELNRNDN